MAEYPSNTLKDRNKAPAKAKPEVKCVVSGKTKTVEATIWSKVFRGIKPTGGQTVKGFVVDEVVIPLLQRALVEGATGAINYLVRGDAYADRKGQNKTGSYISYNKISSGSLSEKYNNYSAPRNPGSDIDNVWFESRIDAQRVLDEMNNIIANYDILTVNAFYDLVGQTSSINQNGEKFGWSDLRNAYITASRGGWVIHLPRAMPVD